MDRWQDSLRSLPIWQLSGAYFVCGATTSMLGVHFVPYAIGQGISPTIAASAFGFMMFLNILGGTGLAFFPTGSVEKTCWPQSIFYEVVPTCCC